MGAVSDSLACAILALVQASSVEGLAQDLMRLMAHLKGRQSGPFEVMARLDLSITQARLLHALSQAGGRVAGVGELAEQLGLSAAATSRAVEGLHRAGLVTRREDDADRRVKHLELTVSGGELIEQLAELHEAALRDFAADLTDEERVRLADALGSVLDRLAASEHGREAEALA